MFAEMRQRGHLARYGGLLLPAYLRWPTPRIRRAGYIRLNKARLLLIEHSCIVLE
jgi:hypothetical protein